MKKTNVFYYTQKILLLVFMLKVVSCVAQKKITANDLLNVTYENLARIDSLNKIHIYYDDSVNTPEVKSLKEFGKFIWYRKKNGQIGFHKKNLKIILRDYVKGNDKYFSSLELYKTYIIATYDNNHQNYLSFSERAFIGGYITDYLYRCQHKARVSMNTDLVGVFTRRRQNQRKRFNREFENYNYYGLKFLKKYYLQEYTPNTSDLYYEKYIKREELTKNPIMVR